MKWNWQQKDWPNFKYDAALLKEKETLFLRQSGLFLGTLKHLNETDKSSLIVDLISNEAIKTSEIEGEFLNRESVQSSIRRNLGLNETNKRFIQPAEQGISEMMVDLYRNFSKPLTSEILFSWHTMLTNGRRDLHTIGAYRTHKEPMQVVSGSMRKLIVHFEAPPSGQMTKEMNQFLKWFNQSAPNGKDSLPALTRAGIAHLYFVSIHPFEDGNGRIGRAIAEKALSQNLGEPTLIALSQAIQSKRNDYYEILEHSNKSNQISDFLVYFADTVLKAQTYTQTLIDFLIEKTKFYDRVRGKLNDRQEKAITRMFEEGVEGFKGGLSAQNYISITKASRATATRDLKDLVDKGAFRQTGELKSTRYFLKLKPQ